MNRVTQESQSAAAGTSLHAVAGTGPSEAGARPHGSRASKMDRVIVRNRWQRSRRAVLAGLVLTALVLAWFWKPDRSRALQIDHQRITIASVSRGQFDDYIPVRGRVAPLRTVFLDAIEGGRVEAVHVEDGASVAPEQLIVELSNAQLQLDVIAREAEVAQQLNNLRNTELSLEQNRLQHKRDLVDINYHLIRLDREIERLTPLAENGLVDDSSLVRLQDEYRWYQERQQVTLESQETDERMQRVQMEQLRSAGEQMERNLEVTRRNLEALSVRAPVAGKLTAFDLEVGQALSKGVNIGQIDDPDAFKLTALIDEFYLPRVDLEQSGRFTASEQDYQLRIRKIYPQVENGMFEVDLAFDGDQPASIRRGQTVQINLQLGSPSASLLIPNGAFYQDTGGRWVFVISEDGQSAIRRSVKLGRRNPQHIEVLDGLDENERIITSPYAGYLEMDRLELGE